MTIRNRLIWLFVGLVAFILLVVLGTAFLLQHDYSQREFRQRLRDRAEVAAYIFLEKDELRSSVFQEFQKRYQRTLTEEIIQIYDVKGEVRFVREDVRLEVPPAVLARIVAGHEEYFTDGSRQAVGIFYRDNQGSFVVVAGAENLSGQARLRYVASILASLFVLSLLLIYVAGRVFAGRALAPIAAMNDQLERISAHDLHLRVAEGAPDRPKDELARLAQTFNRLLDRLEGSFEAQRSFVRYASHELRTPLAASIGEAQLALAREREPAAYRTSLRDLLADLTQLNALLNHLLELAQADVHLPEHDACIRVDELLAEACAAVDPSQRPRLQMYTGRLPDEPEQLELTGNRALLVRALSNLLENALKYSSPHPVRIELAYAPGEVQLRIRDEGIGIAPADLPQVFQPFYRAANARPVAGHGVGLALARKIIEQHGGQLHLHSELGRGTTALVHLPTA
ncbi:HAMP domain-containing sensor histidine kinase [Hymenobacter properus]|uniref:histidine kinase n=1 Tax=Hymenobacter properus TaxID=2791026 RepID=A0A931BE53_9BACT|nr:HAMP domain-containing sensor histidine kinase [Hymenobacter properus]MBF9142149.1 HAMP domain-containing histidine kinase [Hymenobacter properus]MBR7720956.1 HAMP domain-containing histidine kinase [Microvirga sp. SRT04]